MADHEKFVAGPVEHPTGNHQSYSPAPGYSPSPESHFSSPPPQPAHNAQPPAQAPMSAVHQQQPMLQPTAYGEQGGKWKEGVCSWGPCSSCLMSWCLPCLLVGQTSERIRDPSMQNADLLNSDCMIHGAITCFTGCGWIYGMIKRGEIRERYNIEGSGMSDCCVSYWCPCCALIQQDNEVKTRQQAAAAASTQGYQSQPGMKMPDPAYHP